MFRFESPIYLWLLCIIPIVVIIRYILEYKKRRKIEMFGELSLLKSLMPNVSKKRSFIKFIIQISILALSSILLARPQFGTKISNEKRQGIEMVIAIDISNSMLAQDVNPSRLEKSKLLVENLINKFENDKIGIVVFAGDAFIQMPITSDYISAKMFLNSLTPSYIEAQGTDISKAIAQSLQCFSQKEGIGRAIVLITDGEDNEGGAIEKAQEAYKKGVNIFILGVGEKEGSVIPLPNGEYLKDRQGNVVTTTLNVNMCKEIAQAGKGTFSNVNNTSLAQEELNNELTKLQKGETNTVIYSEYNEQFQAVAIFMLLLLIVDVCLLESKGGLFSNIKLFKKK